MKKYLSLLILVLTFCSCGEDLRLNNVAIFQGVKDNTFWSGSNAIATVDIDGKLTIRAITLNETMVLEIPVPATVINPKNKNTFITHILGTTNSKKAIYTLKGIESETIYETAIGVGDGQIIVSEYDGINVSGTFRFNANNTDAESEARPSVNLQNGVFYKVQITNTL